MAKQSKTQNEKQFDYKAANEWRSKCLKELKSIAKGEALFLANSERILRFYVALKNWGSYSNNDYDKTLAWFRENRKDFVAKLDEHLSSNQKLYEDAMKLVYAICSQKTNAFAKKYYANEFLDDIETLCGIRVKGQYYNFFEPSLYRLSYFNKDDNENICEIKQIFKK